MLDRLKTLFGEPIATIGVLEAIIAFALTLTSWDTNTQGVVMAVVIAAGGVYGSWATQDTFLSALIGLVKAGAVLFATLHWSLGQINQAALIAVLTVVVGFLYRTQTSPAEARTINYTPPTAPARDAKGHFIKKGSNDVS